MMRFVSLTGRTMFSRCFRRSFLVVVAASLAVTTSGTADEAPKVPEAEKPSGASRPDETKQGKSKPAGKVRKTAAEWRKQLTPLQYKVARLKATEPAFSGEYWNSKKDGIYHCVCCDQELFDSRTKFESGTGWPSYWQPLAGEILKTRPDNTDGTRRIEVMCNRCDAHLGHVFGDGPPPTGLRFCINSASLKFKDRPAKE